MNQPIQGQLAIYEDETDALRELVRAIGGTKEVGHKLRPDLTPERAGNWLKDCMNPERAERLQPSQLFHLFRLGRSAGVDGPAQFILGNAGYQLVPMEPEDEKARLQREYIEAIKTLRRIAERFEKLPDLRAVA